MTCFSRWKLSFTMAESQQSVRYHGNNYNPAAISSMNHKSTTNILKQSKWDNFQTPSELFPGYIRKLDFDISDNDLATPEQRDTTQTGATVIDSVSYQPIVLETIHQTVSVLLLSPRVGVIRMVPSLTTEQTETDISKQTNRIKNRRHHAKQSNVIAHRMKHFATRLAQGTITILAIV